MTKGINWKEQKGSTNTETTNNKNTTIKHSALGSAENVFFETQDNPSKFIKWASHYLEDHIRNIHQLDRRINRQEWYKQFTLLLKELSGGKLRLKNTLKAYASREGEYKPVAYCAHSFRKKFLQIEKWTKREKNPDDDYQLPKYKIEVVETRHIK